MLYTYNKREYFKYLLKMRIVIAPSPVNMLLSLSLMSDSVETAM